MLARAESRSPSVKTAHMDDPLDEQELEYSLGGMVLMMSLSDLTTYSELLYV
jgi:hypothetical protein